MRKLGLVLVLTLVATFAPKEAYSRFEITIAFDDSSSTRENSGNEFLRQVQGALSVLRDPDTAQLLVEQNVRMAIIAWNGPGSKGKRIIAPMTELSSLSAVELFAAVVSANAGIASLGNTSIGDGLLFALSAFDPSENQGEETCRSVLIATDEPPHGYPAPQAVRAKAEENHITIHAYSMTEDPEGNYARSLRDEVATDQGIVAASYDIRHYQEWLRDSFERNPCAPVA